MKRFEAVTCRVCAARAGEPCRTVTPPRGRIITNGVHSERRLDALDAVRHGETEPPRLFGTHA